MRYPAAGVLAVAIPEASDKVTASLELGMDARDVIREDRDRRITVRFTVRDGDRTSTDQVMLRVAPVLTHHHLRRVERAAAPSSPRTIPVR
jgi:protein-arginine deiminase